MTLEQIVGLGPLIPVLGALLVVAARRSPNWREALSMGAAAATVVCVASLVPAILAGARPEVPIVEILPGLALVFRVEPLGLLFALIAAGLWLPSTLYSIAYLRANDEPRQTTFHACFALSIGCAIGIAFAGNLLTMFVFYELLTLVTYPLVTHHGNDEARRGGRAYLTWLLGTSTLFLLPAIIATWIFAGTLDFVPGGVLRDRLSPFGATILLMLFAFGIGKAAMMPFHRWLPAAMVAPAPVSALLHAVAVVKAGVFCIVKVVFYTFGLDGSGADFSPLIVVAAFTLVFASVVAMRSGNLKRRLAYSTVSQLAYVVLGVALLVPVSVIGAVLHIAVHATGKITLFFVAGAVYTVAHKTEVSELDGIGRRMPWTFGAFALASLSMIGLPPAAGVISKWYILGGAWLARDFLALAALTLGTLLAAGYLLPIVYRAFLKPSPENEPPHGEAPAPMVAALMITAGLTLVMFFLPDVPLALARAMLNG